MFALGYDRIELQIEEEAIDGCTKRTIKATCQAQSFLEFVGLKRMKTPSELESSDSKRVVTRIIPEGSPEATQIERFIAFLSGMKTLFW